MLYNLEVFNSLAELLDINFERDIIFIKDADLKYIYANLKFGKLFNVKIEDIVLKTDNFFIKDKKVIEKCYESDLMALTKNFIIHEEKIDNRIYKVLKLKINLGENKFGILCFSKLLDNKQF